MGFGDALRKYTPLGRTGGNTLGGRVIGLFGGGDKSRRSSTFTPELWSIIRQRMKTGMGPEATTRVRGGMKQEWERQQPISRQAIQTYLGRRGLGGSPLGAHFAMKGRRAQQERLADVPYALEPLNQQAIMNAISAALGYREQDIYQHQAHRERKAALKRMYIAMGGEIAGGVATAGMGAMGR